MNRRSVLGGLLTLLAGAMARAQVCQPSIPNSEGCKALREYARRLHAMPKWYITVSYTTERFKMGEQEVYVSYGEDILGALGNANITVWSAEEWAEMQKK